MEVDIDGLGAVVGMAAAIVALAGTGLAVLRTARSLWFRSIGQRRVQQRQVDGMAIGSSPDYVRGLLGMPQFIQGTDASATHYHRLPGAWISVTYVGGSVGTFAVTVTQRRLWISTVRATLGQLDVKLGRSTMQAVVAAPVAEESWVGARRCGHLKEFYFGNPGGYQTYWLAYNDAGIGLFRRPPNAAIGDSSRPEVSTANTLVVAGPAAPRLRITESRMVGVDLDVVRLAR